jgi:hypothetical protein
MRPGSLLLASLLTLSGSELSYAFYCEGGQQPVPPAVAAQMALPSCGFAATARWGPNGCQLCDSRNMHPNPFTGEDGQATARPARRKPWREPPSGAWQ